MYTKNKDSLQEAKLELERHDKLSTIDALRDCASPKWERLLRIIVRDLTDKTVKF
jgi:hypothetical protein